MPYGISNRREVIVPSCICPECGQVLGKTKMGISSHLKKHKLSVSDTHDILTLLTEKPVRKEVIR